MTPEQHQALGRRFGELHIHLAFGRKEHREMLEGLRAVHDGIQVFAGRQGQRGTDHPVSERPFARAHPVTGRKALWVNRGFTTRIVGLSRNASDALLEMLFRVIERDEFKGRFHWRARSVALRDHRCARHLAIWDYFPHRRYGHRVTVAGDAPR